MNNINNKQYIISSALIQFEDRFKNKFNLEKYNNTNEPTVFFGIYNKSIHL